MATWRSKLGQEFDKSYIEKNEKILKKELDRLRKIPENRVCADCAADGTVWASVNIGVFLCLRCGALHRGLGTHVSIPKGCTGTYLWGPDELEQMRIKGNAVAKEIYGGDQERPGPGASDDAWKKYVHDKYEIRKFAPVRTLESQNRSAMVSYSTADSFATATSTIVDAGTKAKTTVSVPVEEDLISFDDMPTGRVTTGDHVTAKFTDPPDFFAEFGL